MHKLCLTIIIILTFWFLFAEDTGSCVQYAELVCEYCGEDSDACTEIREKSKKHPEDPACEKGLKLLPTVMSDAPEAAKKKVLQALCEKKMPDSITDEDIKEPDDSDTK